MLVCIDTLNFMKPTVHPLVVYRAPKFSYAATLKESWEDLKASIAESSKDFYQQIRLVDAKDISNLDQKTVFTIWKYHNRARYRATPYGSFAGVGVFDIHAGSFPLIVSAEQQVREWIDWSLVKPVELTPAEIEASDIILFSNSSYYFTSDALRYISRDKEGYQMMDTLKDHTAMLHILSVCAQPTRLSDLSRSMDSAGLLDADFPELILEMISLQLLLTSAHPNIIGPDYFKRTGTDLKFAADTPRYQIATRAYMAGSLDRNILAHLPALVEFLHAHVPSVVNSALSHFIERFSQRFEARQVPIMEALDPELGIGYDALEQTASEDDFVAQFSGRKNKDQKSDVLKSHLASALFNSDGKMQPIQLDKMPLPETSPDKPFPNSLNLMFTLSDDLVCLEHAGGSTANILNGRFSIADEGIHILCKDIAQLEASANPDVEFFDIAYLVGSRTDNINRRESFYERELPVLNYSTVNDPLCLRDIMVSVQGSQLILTSKSSGKRLIPRMASAYNYGHSDLPVYRMLCDLQHQGIHSYLHFDTGSLLPELDNYPRIQYKNIILSPAKWIIKRSELSGFTDPTQMVAATRTLLQDRGVSSYFKTGMADQTLVFDMQRDQDIKAFLLLMQKQLKAELSEVILPKSPAMQDTDEKPYAGQYVVSMVHSETLYRGAAANKQLDGLEPTRIFPPGSQWLYFEIYCHPHRANALLCGKIRTFLRENSDNIRHWFFIRYNQHGNHLRLRLKLHEPNQAQHLVSFLSDLLSPELNSGIVSDIQVKTYHRELERYSPELIEQVEIHFHRDSTYVLDILAADLSNEDLYRLSSRVVLRIAQSGLFSTENFEQILAGSAAAFGREHHMETSDYKKLNARYQEYRSRPAATLHDDHNISFENFVGSMVDILHKCPEIRRAGLFTDLFHMHVNRMFSTLQRTHEMILYNYLIKKYKSYKAKGNLNIT